MENKNEIIRFCNEGLELDVRVAPEDDTVWLNREQIAVLFERDVKTITKHINNVYKEHELIKNNTVAKFAPESSIIDYRTGKEQNMSNRKVAITLMVAESKPVEKELMVNLIMNLIV